MTSDSTAVPQQNGRGAGGDPVLEAQLRECFGRVVYSHKTHEKCADQVLARLARIKFWQIVFSALTTGGLLAVVFGPPDKGRIAAGVAAVISTALLALNAYTKANDLGQIAQQHKEAADKLWAVRESYLSLLTDIRGSELVAGTARLRRDELQDVLSRVYESAPRTTAKCYASAAKALKLHEDLTFSDAEIDQFLPGLLRKG